MKKIYLFPEAELILLLSEDIITESKDDVLVDDPEKDEDDTVTDQFAPIV